MKRAAGAPSHSLVQVLHQVPLLLVVEAQNAFGLPIGCYNVARLLVEQGGHLESKNFHGRLSVELHQLEVGVADQMTVAEEFTAEAAKNKDLVRVDLGAAAALAHWELRNICLDLLPHFVGANCLGVQSFDRVKVLFGLN